ncbi:glycosyltransferase family 39 protein [Sandaracinobacter sp. RS1-74]|uniref:ArnT family glycosyltransferase n=1 Tax=Sandaracinobacteroides sayramensis TaxID=2913411 RepID=UPI001ED9E24E|nr:glycosyltransferase family 39 protein [Sandaracinobacteroides sayramensis]MCG2840500.1 glycosyltransferase family 39 protein [Sandaracinobacteroides sayramensis]
MTEPFAPARNTQPATRGEAWLLALIMCAGALLRLNGIGFGLPALNDPDEPLFMTTALDMLRNKSLNPHWFGHPGTVTLYSLVLVSLGVAALGLATGRFADTDAFVAAVYADPGILFLPARIFILLCGLGCIFLLWRIGRRIGGARLGLVAATLLAASPLHVGYSQLIRTDVQASLFMLLSSSAALSIVEHGRRGDYLRAGLWAGLACATKWPAALVLANPLGAALWRRGGWRRIALLLAAAAAGLLLASPFLLLDHQTLLRDLAGEARPAHPSATGEGPIGNLLWYLRGPLRTAFGAAGLLLSVAGVGLMWRRAPQAATALFPAALLLAAVIVAQPLRWERWVVPLLPYMALAAAYALSALSNAFRLRFGRRLPWAEAAGLFLLLLPMLHGTLSRARERQNDTRQIASDWVRAHVPPGSSILIEHAAFDLFQGPWRFRFPLGAAGCVDPKAALAGKIGYDKVEAQRVGRPVIDLGNVAPERMESCRADYALFVNYDRYRQEPQHFRRELERYRDVLRGSCEVKVVRPEAGVSGGWAVRILRSGPCPQPAP